VQLPCAARPYLSVDKNNSFLASLCSAAHSRVCKGTRNLDSVQPFLSKESLCDVPHRLGMRMCLYV